MSYNRVIPRDLFNEANLLKCLGHLAIKLEAIRGPELIEPEPGEAFVIEQDEDGAIACWTVTLKVRDEPVLLSRPLNSRRAWPLYATHHGMRALDEPLEVFEQDGELTAEFRAFVQGEPA